MDLTTQLSTLDCPSTDDEKAKLKNKPYRELVECPNYLVTCTRHNIAHAVKTLRGFSQNLRIKHWKVAKRVVEYLQATNDFFLTIGGFSCASILSVYSDLN